MKHLLTMAEECNYALQLCLWDISIPSMVHRGFLGVHISEQQVRRAPESRARIWVLRGPNYECERLLLSS